MGAERRSYFRINQNILFEYQTVANSQLDNLDPAELFDQHPAMDAFSQLKKIDKQIKPLVAKVAEKDRELAHLLKLMLQKQELLGAQLLAPESKGDTEKTQVNLSEGGLAFCADKALYKGSHLALKLTFLPSFQTTFLIAQVIRCQSEDDNNHQVALKFVKTSSADKELISKQIMQAQLAAQRRQKRTG